MAERKERDLSRAVFVASVAVAALGLAFAAGLYSAAKRNVVYRLIHGAWDDLTLVAEESENIAGTEPVHFLQPSVLEGSGVTVNGIDDGALVLLVGFFDGGNELRLVRRDGSPAARWPVRFSDHFPDPSHMSEPPETDWNIDIHGAVANPDGSVVFNWEYGGSVKLGRCGEVVWTLAHPTHHSVEPAEGGGYWIPGREYVAEADAQEYLPFAGLGTDRPYQIDLILKVGEDGRILESRSVPRILYASGLETLLTATGFNFVVGEEWTHEIMHVNDIEELTTALAPAFPGFEAGDLLVSSRQQNLLVVIDPDTWRVKWHQIGPWRRQHDPDFTSDGAVTVFNNNVYGLAQDADERTRTDWPRVSNVLRLDPATGEAEVVVGGREGQEFLSVIRGKQDRTPDGGTIVTDFGEGRVFEVDAAGRVVWDYVNRYDETWVAEMTEARLYPAGYFAVESWDCPED